MDTQKQKEIFCKIIKELNTLNQFLNEEKIDEYKLAKYLNESSCDIKTNDLNLYLSSLCNFVFEKTETKIILSKEDINKFVIVNFVNTILNELGFKEFEIEAI